MKYKINMFLVLMLVGCSLNKTVNIEPETTGEGEIVAYYKYEPEVRYVRNAKCTDIKHIEIFDVLLSGSALAMKLIAEYDTVDPSKIMYVPRMGDIKYYDGLQISVPQGYCITIDDTYRYTTVEGVTKTIPIIKFEHEFNQQ